MRIIILQGMPNRGKTSTLGLVWSVLTINGGISTNRQPLGGDPNDFSDIVIINNQRVAFYTMGDYSNYLANAIHDYANQGCDVLVCALSIDNAKVRANNAINQFNNTRRDKTIESVHLTEQQANDIDAQWILNLV
ncbi:hypothetical protein [Chryseobacterium salivictor]|uniref:Uncharacterized protein n=1 Tax=Chryseobacterium salivictor TaxID=2547600 RepID=A0A4P6ZJK1_9FLAO|nr:hypothetical protein [Chryseobacterium salivictor]QBO59585.1 hypothetical protein NBC122_02784 [Chryseobacterium salivictor]